MKIDVFPVIPSAPTEISIPDPTASHAGGSVFFKQEHGTLIWIDDVPDRGRAVLKMYRHRGPLRTLRKHLLTFRAQREYDALCRLVDHDIACTPPLFWTYGKSPAHGNFEILATVELRGAVAVREWLNEQPHQRDQIDFSQLFGMIRRMHKAGVRHGALSFKNVLLHKSERPNVQFYIIDMSRAVLFPQDITGTRMAWFDLLDICRKVTDLADAHACPDLLRAYGMQDRSIEKLLTVLPDYQPTRHTRNRLRGEFALRARCRWGGAGQPGH